MGNWENGNMKEATGSTTFKLCSVWKFATVGYERLDIRKRPPSQH